MSTIAERLQELGLELPGPYPPHDPLDAIVVHSGRANVIVIAVTVDAALSVLHSGLGSLDRITRVLTVLGFVASAPGFVEQPAVIDGASHLLYEVFGDSGRHSRSAIGVAALPRGGAVEPVLDRPAARPHLQRADSTRRLCCGARSRCAAELHRGFRHVRHEFQKLFQRFGRGPEFAARRGSGDRGRGRARRRRPLRRGRRRRSPCRRRARTRRLRV